MSGMLARWFRRGRRDRGATMVEYGLMVVLIALVVIIAVNPLGTAVSSLFDTSRQSL